jgi:hypothetical protein
MPLGNRTPQWYEQRNAALGLPRGTRHADQWYERQLSKKPESPPEVTRPAGPGEGWVNPITGVPSHLGPPGDLLSRPNPTGAPFTGFGPVPRPDPTGAPFTGITPPPVVTTPAGPTPQEIFDAQQAQSRREALAQWWAENGAWRSIGTQEMPPETNASFVTTGAGFGRPALPHAPPPATMREQDPNGVPGMPAPPAAPPAINALAQLAGPVAPAPTSAAPAAQSNPFTGQQPDAGAWSQPAATRSAQPQSWAQPAGQSSSAFGAPNQGLQSWAQPARQRRQPGMWGQQTQAGTWGPGRL